MARGYRITPTPPGCSSRARAWQLGWALLVCGLSAGAAQAAYTHFESPPVHPVELTPDGQRLLVVHIADQRLVVFTLAAGTPIVTAEIPVGVEPVTVRARSNTEAWVVNHVSDSINIVDLTTGNVRATLLVGDEPTDVVFAGSPQRAFVCVSQEDLLRVYDPQDLTAAPAVIPLPASDPRSLAVSGGPGAGTKVYVTALEGGNRTTIVPATVVQGTLGLPPPNPPMSPTLPAAPSVGLIVRHNGTAWVDELGRSWNAMVPYTLVDNDVVEVDVASRSVIRSFHEVGTSMFNVAVDAATGHLYVSNQEALNQVRFEPNVRGRFVRNRITEIDPVSGVPTPYQLNAHIDYAVPGGSAGERALSLSLPLDLTVDPAGNRLYVAAMGSHKVGVVDTATGSVLRRIPVGQGPAGLALDAARDQLYVYNRFAASISVVHLTGDSSVEIPLGFDPTPPNIRDGRRLLYDGENSSAHGDLSCASCHLFAGIDNLGWDLGNPQGQMIPPPAGADPLGLLPDYHPMKGPMMTQALKGLSGTEPLHWRGDRATFADFNQAFVDLMGRAAPLPAGDLALFQDFIFSVRYPGSPYRNLDGTHLPAIDGGNPANGEQLFLTGNLVGGLQCNSCHTLPTGENGLIIPGNLLNESEGKEVPQLRNLYEKTRFDNTASSNVRGFGYTHDGAVDDLFTFLQFPRFTFADDTQRRDVAAFLMAFDTGTPTAVGAQWTMTGSNLAAGLARLVTLQGLADANSVGLIAKGRDATGRPRGWVYAGGGAFLPDRGAEPPLTLLALAGTAGVGAELTFTAVLKGDETRLGVDRDLDGFLDNDELDAGSNPGDPASTPDTVTAADPAVAVAPARLWMQGPNPTSFSAPLAFELPRDGSARLAVFDVRGRLVREVVQRGRQAAGSHATAWDLRDAHGQRVPAGVYFVRLEADGSALTRRLTVVR